MRDEPSANSHSSKTRPAGKLTTDSLVGGFCIVELGGGVNVKVPLKVEVGIYVLVGLGSLVDVGGGVKDEVGVFIISRV